MKHIIANNFRDLMNGHASAEIINLYGGNVVRKLTVNGDRVTIDALVPPVVSVNLETEIVYQPWFMDRGSLLFKCSGIPELAKICTEFDEIRYPDGSVYEIRQDARTVTNDKEF
jgi:hypothetical protein